MTIMVANDNKRCYFLILTYVYFNKYYEEDDMLLKYGAKNFACFLEGIEISLELGAQCPTKISKGKPVTNLLCIKGANGSGKTIALKILAFLTEFCCRSFNNEPDEKIWIDSFFNNKDPIDIFCDFEFNGTKYRYELSLTDLRVISEKLSRKVNRLSTVFERSGNSLTYCIKEFEEFNKIKLRTNASIVSTAYQYELASVRPIYKFFNSIITNFTWFSRPGFSTSSRKISQYYYKYPKALERAVKFIKECDLGITDIRISESKDEKGNKYYFPIFHHDTNAKKNWLTYYDQSLGTKTLFLSFPYYISALGNGDVLVMDEFDTDFHPAILPKIISLFDDEKKNLRNSQMIYSTHNTDILEYMGKYRTIIINKESSESYGFRLDEIPGDIIRNDRLIAPVYRSGKIGGVPKL